MDLLKGIKKEYIEKYPLYSQDGKEENSICWAKFFLGSYTWYVTEIDEEHEICFGIIDGQEVEYGYFSISELQGVRVKGFEVERDLWFTARPVKEIKNERVQEFLNRLYKED